MPHFSTRANARGTAEGFGSVGNPACAESAVLIGRVPTRKPQYAQGFASHGNAADYISVYVRAGIRTRSSTHGCCFCNQPGEATPAWGFHSGLTRRSH